MSILNRSKKNKIISIEEIIKYDTTAETPRCGKMRKLLIEFPKKSKKC